VREFTDKYRCDHEIPRLAANANADFAGVNSSVTHFSSDNIANWEQIRRIKLKDKHFTAWNKMPVL
jgi:hypothetical protein